MRYLKLSALVLLFIVVVVAGIFINSLGPIDADSSVKKDFVVISGQSTTEISEKLKREGLIKNSFSFYVYMKLLGGKILPGTYELSPSNSASQTGFTLGSGKLKTERLTIIEGWRASQIAEYIINDKKLKNVADFLEKAEKYEGYLFPDTYEVKVDVTSDELIAILRDTFVKKTKELNLTPETVILASIVEREAQTESDRPQVAGVYSNRIKIGMRLEADPTVQYAKGSWASITVADYRSTISPYNTYLNDGLPPGPISNPGVASLKAAKDPAVHDYIFFFHAKGETHFSKTLAEHRAKVNQYF